ncbi:MAG: DUF2298 domain-containing protein [Omnitrophica WOR_2 bacterium]
MIHFILWYLTVTLLGLASFPIAYRMLPGLPDRGYAFSRALGLLIWGYLFWLLGSVDLLHNNLGGQVFAFLLLLAVSGLMLRKLDWQEARQWWHTRKGLVITIEALFLLAFAGWAIVRAANPAINTTEKPMEEAFINAILRSPSFPPHDPWLSGFGISYYYFGYVMVAMLARITATPGNIAFNLGVALVFALSALGAYGLIYNLLTIWRKDRQPQAGETGEAPAPDEPQPVDNNHHLGLALSGPLFILLASNLEGFLEVLHARGLLSPGFWTWLGIADLNQAPAPPYSWLPRLYGTGGWWWWRASRVLQDLDFANSPREVIDEFPFFSYMLADLHPHVLAMPFAFLMMALALNMFMGGARGSLRIPFLDLRINPFAFLLASVALGSMFFLNAWDFPVYIVLFSAAYALWRLKEDRQETLSSGIPGSSSLIRLLQSFLSLAVALGIAGIVLYLPFYMSFSSQAGGIIPNAVYVTRGAQFWIMFAVLLLPVGAYLIYTWRRKWSLENFFNGLLAGVGITLLLYLLSYLLIRAIPGLPALTGINPLAGEAPQAFLASVGAPDFSSLLREDLVRRVTIPGTWVTLTILIGSVIGLFLTKYKPVGLAVRERDIESFILLLVLLGGFLTLVPEFVFLRDQFGYRINTIFKFYYQAWLLWGIAAAFYASALLTLLRRAWGILYTIGLILILGMSLVYTVLGLWDKTQGFNPPGGLTLDGRAYLAESGAQDELAAIRWLQNAPYGVIVEAVRPDGGQYSEFARISEYSGDPTVLGWVGHEVQWRGGTKEIGSRQTDIQSIYTTGDWTQTQALLKQYDIRYVIVGVRERSIYRVNETKFKRFLKPVFQQGNYTIYEVPNL